ncbi:hypothetical protein CNMCM5623_002493 [Aspergillus felis]|uniref:Alpha-L-arabinofuranosidase n=1 Tax=Aspergillus felis TaxID=1287682 RepID=A0A8H6QCK6_9EURO|nr:hypothetical protein CNMCM5623_002493 [Aspergillus felis]
MLLIQASLERASVHALCILTMGALVAAGPCDYYSWGGTPCVAAHSTTRALYSSYNGLLYQVIRESDWQSKNIGTLYAVRQWNHLTQAPPGAFNGPASNGYDNLAIADSAPVLMNSQKVYGVHIKPGMGYRNNAAKGTATGDEAQGMYAIFDGTTYNDQCCFDYGNAETSGTDTGAGHMEAINFGNCTTWGSGSGSGPWIMADLENGLFGGPNFGWNGNNPTISHRFLTAVVKGESNQFAVRGGDATSGSLSTFYSGLRPSGYNPMHKEGAIILGTGGDNSHGSKGTFYEGVMTSGYPSDSTEDAVQADIVAAHYST